MRVSWSRKLCICKVIENMHMQLSIQPWICAPGTHYRWMFRGNVDSKLTRSLMISLYSLMNINYSERGLYVDMWPSSGANHPFSIDVFESKLYWVSKESGTVQMMDKFGRGINRTLQAGLLMPRAIKIFQQHRYDLTGIYNDQNDDNDEDKDKEEKVEGDWQ